jgi:hypothetical protein
MEDSSQKKLMKRKNNEIVPYRIKLVFILLFQAFVPHFIA